MADWWFFSTRDSKKTNSHSSSCSFKPIEAHHLFSTFASSAPPYTPLKLNNALSFFLSFLFFFFFLNRSDNGMKPQALNVSLSLFLSILVIACKRTFECRVLLFLFFSRMCLVCFIPPSGRLNLFRLDTFGKWVQSTMSIKKRSKFRTRLVLGILSLPDREAFFQVGWFHNHRWNSLSLSLSLKSKAISYGSFRSLFAFGKMRVRRREAARQDDERWTATMRMGRSEFLMRRRRWSGKRRRRPAEWMHPRSAHNAILLLYTTAQ